MQSVSYTHLNLENIRLQMIGIAVQFPELFKCIDLYDISGMYDFGRNDHFAFFVQGFFPKFISICRIFVISFQSFLNDPGIFTEKITDADHRVAPGRSRDRSQFQLTVYTDRDVYKRQVTGWLKLSDTWYYMNTSGARVSNCWTWVGNSCYYFDKDGKMAVDTWIGDYYVNADGAWVPGQKKDDQKNDQNGSQNSNQNQTQTKAQWVNTCLLYTSLMVMMSTTEKIISDIMINSWKKMENYIISMEMAV